MFRRRRPLARICIILVLILPLAITIYVCLPIIISSSSIKEPIAANFTSSTTSTSTSSSTSTSTLIINNNKITSTTSVSSSTITQSNIPDIFDLSLWRHLLLGQIGNQTLCPVPSQYKTIVDAYCRAHNRDNCSHVPCTMIYLSNEFIESVHCLRGGKIAFGVKPDWICRKSPALELFSNPYRKPSVRAEAYTPVTSDLYARGLSPFRDTETSRWGITLQGESLAYYSSIAERQRLLPLFDITMGYDRRYFDLITDAHITDYVDQITNRLHKRLGTEQVFRKKVAGHAPILWINSNCNTPSNRTAYVLELMRHVHIDIRGKCGNPNWNQTISPDPKVLANEKLTLIPQYLFTIAIENSLEYDYVTEKLWQPLAAGSVPIYLGAPNIEEWLPCPKSSCIINLRHFSSVADAANLINELVHDRRRYLEYHHWRRVTSELQPSFLKMIDYFHEAKKYSIKCLLCDMVYRNDRGRTRQRLLAANNPFNDTFPSLA